MRHRVPGVLIAAVLACGDSEPLRPLPSPSGSVRLEVISGSDQPGASGELLAQPFTVRVHNLGTGIPRVPVTWTVTSGSGEFGLLGGRYATLHVTPTGADGVASVTFRPTVPGSITVAASAEGVEGSAAIFTVGSSGLPVVLIRFGPYYYCDEPSEFFVADSTIAVGSLVEWEYGHWLPPGCQARIEFRSEPAGGLPINSGILVPGERFGVVVGVAGDWIYDDTINGGTGTLRVR